MDNLSIKNIMSVKTNIKILQDYAATKDGQLISTEYKDNRTKMEWRCKNGHVWNVCWHSVKADNTWCKKCLEKNILDLQEYAASKNGQLISTKYITMHNKYTWQCSEGHQWKATWGNVKNNSTWCPECNGNTVFTINILQSYAKKMFGLLLSTKYINSTTDLLWQCKNGHRWKAKWKNIFYRNTWCPECSWFKTEREVRNLLEQKLGIDFKKHRIYYDSSNKQRYYEFDGYNEEHKIAFEYHGYQHYIYPNRFNKTEEDFIYYRQKDRDKEQYCIENNIKLYIIPYTEKTNIENYITMLLREI